MCTSILGNFSEPLTHVRSKPSTQWLWCTFNFQLVKSGAPPAYWRPISPRKNALTNPDNCHHRGTPDQQKCLSAVVSKLPPGKQQGRTALISGRWDHVPAGCSFQRTDYAAHYNTKSDPSNPSNGYTSVCNPDSWSGLTTQEKHANVTLEGCAGESNEASCGCKPCRIMHENDQLAWGYGINNAQKTDLLRTKNAASSNPCPFPRAFFMKTLPDRNGFCGALKPTCEALCFPPVHPWWDGAVGSVAVGYRSPTCTKYCLIHPTWGRAYTAVVLLKRVACDSNQKCSVYKAAQCLECTGARRDVFWVANGTKPNKKDGVCKEGIDGCDSVSQWRNQHFINECIKTGAYRKCSTDTQAGRLELRKAERALISL